MDLLHASAAATDSDESAPSVLTVGHGQSQVTVTTAPDEPPVQDKSPEAFKNISEVAGLLEVQQYVLRFWESRFSQIRPVKMRGGRRYYRPEDVELLKTIKHLLYKQGYTIKGAKKALSGLSVEEKLPPREAKAKTGLSEKQVNQLSVIRHELIGMRDTLKPFVF